MKVPLLDLNAQLDPIQSEIERAISGVICSCRYINGPSVVELEEKIATYTGARFGIGVSSGTDALLAALMALGVGAGDLVLTTNYSFFATAGVIARLGARPVLLDIEPHTYNLAPAELKTWIAEHPGELSRVKAVIPVHLFGQCCEMEEILAICRKHQWPVIEDAAQAIGATYPNSSANKKAGSMGMLGCFSFFPSKNLGGMGDGGMIVTNDHSLAEKLVRLRNHGAHPKYFHSTIGGNFRLDELQAAVLLVKLRRLDEWHSQRRENARYYDEHLSRLPVATPTVAFSREDHIYNQYVITVAEDRDALKAHLEQSGIGTEVYYPRPFHLQECFAYLNYAPDQFPNSTYAAEHSLALPIYPELTTEMQDYVVERIGAFYGK